MPLLDDSLFPFTNPISSPKSGTSSHLPCALPPEPPSSRSVLTLTTIPSPATVDTGRNALPQSRSHHTLFSCRRAALGPVLPVPARAKDTGGMTGGPAKLRHRVTRSADSLETQDQDRATCPIANPPRLLLRFKPRLFSIASYDVALIGPPTARGLRPLHVPAAPCLRQDDGGPRSRFVQNRGRPNHIRRASRTSSFPSLIPLSRPPSHRSEKEQGREEKRPTHSSHWPRTDTFG